MDKQEIQQAAKPFIWGFVVGVVGLSIVAFSFDWVVTSSTAQEMAENATEQGRAELAATVCVDRFLQASDARAQLASLKETRSWERDGFIAKGGWATLSGMKNPVSDAAELCAERLAGMDLAAKETAGSINDNATTAQ